MNIKKKLYAKCLLYVEKREQTVNTTINAAKKALNSETKSSAGDKHETGRAMLQLEMEKAGQQLHSITKMKEILAKVNTNNISDIAHLGSIVTTNKANYYLSISKGEIKINNINYYAISVSSPIGKLLLGKQTADTFIFNGQKITIETIM